jgi:hypothetical protein
VRSRTRSNLLSALSAGKPQLHEPACLLHFRRYLNVSLPQRVLKTAQAHVNLRNADARKRRERRGFKPECWE